MEERRIELLQRNITQEIILQLNPMVQQAVQEFLDTSATPGTSSVHNTSLQDSILHLTTVMEELKQDVKNISQMQTSLKNSQDFISAQFDGLKESLVNLKETSDQQRKEITLLKQKVQDLEEENDGFHVEVDNLEQYHRRNNLEFHGINFDKNENCKSLIQDLASKLGVKLDDWEVSTAHRLYNQDQKKSTKNAPPIIARFVCRDTRNLIYSKRRHLLSKSGTSNFYINENLTKQKRDLLYEVRQRRKQHHYKYLWTNNCKIFVRKNDNARALTISCLDDLEKIR